MTMSKSNNNENQRKQRVIKKKPKNAASLRPQKSDPRQEVTHDWWDDLEEENFEKFTRKK